MTIEFQNRSLVSFRSAEKYDNLRAEGIHRLVIDEAARVEKEAWESVLRPALSDTKGDAMFITTPKGRNWFYSLWLMGQRPDEFPDYRSWRFPSSDNPLITPEEIEQVRATMPENIFRQEFLAEFIDEAGEVIPNVDSCVVLPGLEKERKKEKQYYAGIDLARVQDFTVVCIIDNEYRLVDFLRLRQVNWDIQKNEIEAMLKKYDALSDCDSTGVGDPIVESLVMSGASVRGFVFSATSKRALIQNLIFGFSNKQIKLPPIPELISELKALTYKQGPSGQLSYEAPAGMHDDCVMALALAYWSATRERWPGIFAL
jgi:Terminase-like family.